jgi:hypothetical protein
MKQLDAAVRPPYRWSHGSGIKLLSAQFYLGYIIRVPCSPLAVSLHPCLLRCVRYGVKSQSTVYTCANLAAA